MNMAHYYNVLVDWSHLTTIIKYLLMSDWCWKWLKYRAELRKFTTPAFNVKKIILKHVLIWLISS